MTDLNSNPTILRSIIEVREWRKTRKSVAFVPTMGALHQGHLDLVRLAKAQGEEKASVIVSIFVNPSQFSPTEDLSSYPRDESGDLSKLVGLADAVFFPETKEMYPNGITLERSEQVGTFVEVLGISHVLEGAIRSHFFRGVATVVCKLLNIVQPNTILLGQKDAQQCVVVRRLIDDLCLDVKVLVGPTTRDNSTGLALSSRNQYLSTECRATEAPVLYKALKEALCSFNKGNRLRQDILSAAHKILGQHATVQLDYLSLAHPKTLKELDQVDASGALLSGAIRVGPTKVRILDNILLGGAQL